MGDKWGETDTRFVACALISLSLLGTLRESESESESESPNPSKPESSSRKGKRIDIEKTVNYLKACKNYDGGFGNDVGAESHAAWGEHFFLPSLVG